MHWAAPHFAWFLLLALPVAVLMRRAGHRRAQALQQLRGPGEAMSGKDRVRPGMGLALRMVAFLLLVAALCRPQWGQEVTEQSSRGVDILIALDVSRSMLADDQHPDRLTVAKRAVFDLLPRLRGDRIGLIAFAGSAFLVCPLTSDYATFAEMLGEVGPDTIPLGGTSLASALGEARRVFGDRAGGGRVLVLITDGEDHGEHVDLPAALPARGVVVHALAAGTRDGGLIPVPGGGFLKSREGEIVKSRPSTSQLQSLAAAGGGRLWELAADPRALQTLYERDLGALARQDFSRSRQQWVERFQIPLALAVLLLFAEPLIALRRRT